MTASLLDIVVVIIPLLFMFLAGRMLDISWSGDMYTRGVWYEPNDKKSDNIPTIGIFYLLALFVTMVFITIVYGSNRQIVFLLVIYILEMLGILAILEETASYMYREIMTEQYYDALTIVFYFLVILYLLSWINLGVI